jgi:hypothetical protein
VNTSTFAAIQTLGLTDGVLDGGGLELLGFELGALDTDGVLDGNGLGGLESLGVELGALDTDGVFDGERVSGHKEVDALELNSLPST